MAPHLKLRRKASTASSSLAQAQPDMRFLAQQSWVPFDNLDKRVKDNAERDAAKLDLDKLRADHAKWHGEMEAQVKTLKPESQPERHKHGDPGSNLSTV
jgi:hypothetical protein